VTYLSEMDGISYFWLQLHSYFVNFNSDSENFQISYSDSEISKLWEINVVTSKSNFTQEMFFTTRTAHRPSHPPYNPPVASVRFVARTGLYSKNPFAKKLPQNVSVSPWQKQVSIEANLVIKSYDLLWSNHYLRFLCFWLIWL